MHIIVIGVGEKLENREKDMKKIAGSKGTVLVFGSFEALINSVDDILEATCRKFLLFPSYLLVI